MNILFMGTPDIAAAALEAILDAGHTVCGVYTRADKPVGRKQVLTAPPVKRTAMAHGIPVFQPGPPAAGLQMVTNCNNFPAFAVYRKRHARSARAA